MSKKVSQLTERLLADLDGQEFLLITDDNGGTPTSYKVKVATILDLLDGLFNAIAMDISNMQAEIDALQIYDVGGAWNGVIDASTVVTRYIAVRAITFPDNFAGSQGKAGVAATGSTVFDIKKNGSNVGTMTWAAAGTTATFNTTGTTVSLAVGDIIEVVAPATPDVSLANITFTLTATRD